MVTGPVVPGHGAVVDAAFVRGQRDEIAVLASLARSIRDGVGSMSDALAAAPFPPEFAQVALERALLQLEGAVH